MIYNDGAMNLFSCKPNLNFAEINFISSRKLAMFKMYLYYYFYIISQISMIATLILAKTVQLVLMK